MITNSIEDKQNLLKPCPVVYPSQQEFDSPIKYLSSPEIQTLGAKYGIIKLVPPKDWNPPFSLDSENFKFKPRVQQLSLLNLMNRTRIFFRDGLLRFIKMQNSGRPNYTCRKIPKTPYFTLANRSKVYYYDLFCNVEHFINNQNTNRHLKTNNDIRELYNSISNDFGQLATYLNEAYDCKDPNEVIHHYNAYLKDYSIFLKEKELEKQSRANKHKIHNLKPENYDAYIDEYRFNENPYNEDDSGNSADEDEDEDEDAWCHVCGLETDEVKMLICDGCDKGYHTYCVTPKINKIPKGKWFCENCLVGTGDYGFVMSENSYSLNEFKQLNDKFTEKYFRGKQSKKYYQQLSSTYLSNKDNQSIRQNSNGSSDYEKLYVDFLEREFWDNLVNNENSTIKVNYGADIHNMKKGQISGFPMNFPYSPQRSSDKYMSHEFNLTQLPFANGSLLNHLSEKISGMTVPWLYIGALFSTFCWHLEDHYMLSANYCHLGDIKKWYGVPESSSGNFEYFMKLKAPHLFEKQPDLLHQLVTLISPFELIENGVDCYYANQKPGEFVITFPKCYHAGFNCGFNVNEAVNFTNSEWLKYGISALEDYKRFKKPSVFSQFQLCYNILKDFLADEEFVLNKSESSFQMKLVDHDMICLCIAYLLKIAKEQCQVINTKLEIVERIPTNEKVEIIHKQATNNIDASRNCKICDEFCDISYIEIMRAIKTMPLELPPTPESSPKHDRKMKRRRNSSKQFNHDDNVAATTKKFKVEDSSTLDDAINNEKGLKISKFCKIYEDYVKSCYEEVVSDDKNLKNTNSCYCLKHLESLLNGEEDSYSEFEKVRVCVNYKEDDILHLVHEVRSKLKDVKIID